jgi:selenide,water dikinase
LVPAGSFANRNFCEKSLQVAPGIDPVVVELMSDAQTNG